MKNPNKPSRSIDDESRVAALMQTYRSDPRIGAVVDAFEANTNDDGRPRLGLHGLTVNGKLFARFTEGTLVVKLPEDRVLALVAARVGTQCEPGHGRLRKWLKVTSKKVSWIDLANARAPRDAADVRSDSHTLRSRRRARQSASGQSGRAEEDPA